MYKTIASFNGDVKIYDGKLGYANLLKLTGEMPKNIEHIVVLDNDNDFGDFYSWSNKIVENNFGSNFKEGFPIVNFSKDGSEVEVINAYGELENGVSVLFDKDSSEWVVEFAKGGGISDHEETYKKWKSLVNMSKSELENFYNSEEGKEAGLSSSKANELGIHRGRESARWIMKMKDTPHQDWTPKMWEWAKRQISFISRMSGNKGGLYDDKGNKTRKHTSLLIWGHNPKKYESGGSVSQTPAPKSDKVYGSKVNAKGSSKDTKIAKEIKFDAKTLLSINEKVREHNKQHPNKKITLASAKAVVRRGMGAYSSTHRPTISGGKPNSRVAWGLARLNAFMYKIIHGKSKSGKYKQDDDLINELGYSVKSYEDGGSLELLAPNGKPSNLTPEQWHLVRTDAFKAFFGDWEKLAYAKINDSGIDEITLENLSKDVSKVVDENGEPLVVYHGTPDGRFTIFDENKFGSRTRNINSIAFFFTPSLWYAEAYSEKHNNEAIKIYEDMFGEKPRAVEPRPYAEEKMCFLNVKNPYYASSQTKEDLTYAKINNFDGLILKYKNKDEIFEIASFSSNQIKIADGTNTTFDANNPDIRYESGGGLFKPHKNIEQIAKEKNVSLPYAKIKLNKGMKIESEHSNDKKVQEIIALQHLDENIKYYDKIK